MPPHNGVIGAVGAALLAREASQRTGEPHRVPRLGPAAGRLHGREFICKACANRVRRAGVHGRGREDVLGRQVLRPLPQAGPRSTRSRSSPISSPPRGAAAGAVRRRHAPRAGVGAHGRLPARHVHLRPAAVLVAFFAELGYGPVLSPESDKRDPRGGRGAHRRRAVLPDPVAHGHVQWLFDEGVDFVFVPNQVNEETEFMQTTRTPAPGARRCRSWSSTRPARGAPEQDPRPARALPRRARGPASATSPAMMRTLGVSKTQVRERAGRRLQGAGRFRGKLLRRRRRGAGAPGARRRARRRPRRPPVQHVRQGRQPGHPAQAAQVLRGQRDPAGLPAHPTASTSTPWCPTCSGTTGARSCRPRRFVRDRENLHLIYMTNFKCGPDSYIKHFVREASGKPFLTLQFDEHQNDAGVHDALRGVPGQQGLPPLVVAGRGRRGS